MPLPIFVEIVVRVGDASLVGMIYAQRRRRWAMHRSTNGMPSQTDAAAAALKRVWPPSSQMLVKSKTFMFQALKEASNLINPYNMKVPFKVSDSSRDSPKAKPCRHLAQSEWSSPAPRPLKDLAFGAVSFSPFQPQQLDGSRLGCRMLHPYRRRPPSYQFEVDRNVLFSARSDRRRLDWSAASSVANPTQFGLFLK